MAITPPTTVRINSDIKDKFIYCAWFDRESFTDRLNRLIAEDIARFEKDHGAISPEQVAKAGKK